MDYEKKYKEALERAREALNEIPLESYGARKIIIDAFPELTESEDERTRKWLLDYAIEMIAGLESDISLSTYDGIKGHDPEAEAELAQWQKARAYLEKQKENIEKEYVFRPLAGTDINTAALQAIRRANEGDRLVLAFNGAYIPVRKGCNANKIVDIYEAFIEKQKEQKPADEQFPPLEGLDAIKAKYYDDGFKNGFDEGVESVKPAEWSEEDENKLNHILEIVHIASGREVSVDEKEELESLLKSLRPQPHKEIYLGAKHDLAIKFMNYLDENRPEWKMSLSESECEDIDKAFKENNWDKIMRYVYRFNWKPSEEQIYSLGTVVKGYDECNVGSVGYNLKELYKHLKKL